MREQEFPKTVVLKTAIIHTVQGQQLELKVKCSHSEQKL